MTTWWRSIDLMGSTTFPEYCISSSKPSSSRGTRCSSHKESNRSRCAWAVQRPVGFWKLALNPGRPLAFGHVRNAAFFGLPGNPVSVMATFYQLVQPALQALAGIPNPGPPLTVTAVCTTPLRKKPGRREFQRGVFKPAGDGRLEVSKAGREGSGVLSSMSAANCFIVLAEDSGPVSEGDEVAIQPFAAFV